MNNERFNELYEGEAEINLAILFTLSLLHTHLIARITRAIALKSMNQKDRNFKSKSLLL
jgi:hypothetical protein